MEDRSQHDMGEMTATPIIAVIRARSSEGLVDACTCLYEAGIQCIEITMTVPGAPDVIRQLSSDLKDAVLGAGTVLTSADAEICCNAGARFIVSPVFNPEVVQVCSKRHVVAIPGALTPTEIFTAWRGGADMVKVFPAERLGSKYISDLAAPFPRIPLVPTGGITSSNAREYLDAGATLVCVGSWLLGGSFEAPFDMDILRRRADEILASVRVR